MPSLSHNNHYFSLTAVYRLRLDSYGIFCYAVSKNNHSHDDCLDESDALRSPARRGLGFKHSFYSVNWREFVLQTE